MRRLIQYCIAVVIFCFAFWGVTYTADWAGYEYFFNEGEDIKEDIGSVFLFNILKDHGYDDFRVAFRIHIILMGVLFAFVFNKLGLNPIPYTILLIVLSYVPLANQIRYYVAFPAMLLSVIYFIEKRYIKCILLFIFAIVFHRTTVLLGLVFLIYYLFSGKTLNNSRHKKYITLGLSFSLLFLLIMYTRLGVYLGDYAYYTSSTQKSSTFGGMFNLLPCLLSIPAVLYYDQRVKKRHVEIIRYNYNQYRLFLLFSIATCILMPLCLRIQILNTRMIVRFFTIWIAYLVYIQRTGKKLGIRINTSYVIVVLITFNILHQTLLPYWFGIVETPIPQELLMILTSYQL